MKSLAAVAAVAAVALFTPAHALSASVCDVTGMTWVTAEAGRLQVRVLGVPAPLHAPKRGAFARAAVRPPTGRPAAPGPPNRSAPKAVGASTSSEGAEGRRSVGRAGVGGSRKKRAFAFCVMPSNPPHPTPTTPPPTHTHSSQGAFPHYRQVFYCSGNLNLEDRPVDACVSSGAACDGAAAAEAFCAYLGFDGSVPDAVRTEASALPTRAMTGEWCVAGGAYDGAKGQTVPRAEWDDLVAAYGAAGGKGCTRLAAVACYRSRESLGVAWVKAGEKAKAVAAKEAAAAAAPAGDVSVASVDVASGGRRLLASA